MRNIKSFIIKEGWLTPTSYSNNYAKPENKQGVYIFVHKYIKDGKLFIKPLYIGSACMIKRRLIAHEIIQKCKIYCDLFMLNNEVSFSDVVYYFRYENNYRKEEIIAIKKHQPKFNIIHKYNG